MINLRYHIVSITAVFLAIGIGLTLGSTFLDRATVDNLQGQLDNLQGRLEEREEQVNELQGALDDDRAVRDALDEQGAGLLAGLLEDVPVAVVASRGVDEDQVEGAVEALEASGAVVHGLLWLTDRWTLDEDAEVDDLSSELAENTDDPSRLRRMSINRLGDELAEAQELPETDGPLTGEVPDGTQDPTTGDPATEDPTTADPAVQDPTADDPATGDPGTEDPAGVEPAAIDTLTALVETGFVDFEPVPDGLQELVLPQGTRFVLVGGSGEVPDDLVIEPLAARMAAAQDGPLLAVATSARPGDGEVSDLVAVIRESEEQREVLSTVDDLQHFGSWAAMVLALRDTAEGIVGHYGVADGASRLLPPMSSP